MLTWGKKKKRFYFCFKYLQLYKRGLGPQEEKKILQKGVLFKAFILSFEMT